MLNGRMIAILRELMSAETMITSEYLANVIQVTSRTVRNDMKELTSLVAKYGAAIKSIRGTGYKLIIHDDQLFRKFLLDVSNHQSSTQGIRPTSPEERVQYLIKRLLLIDKYVKLDDLADELYVSKSTIQNDLRDVKKVLNHYELVLHKRPNYGVELKGDEMKVRYCMSEYIFNQIGTRKENYSILPKGQMTAIRSVVLEQIKENDITLSDIGLNNLVIHIAIACRRIQDQNYVMLRPNEIEDVISQKEYKVASEIVGKIESGLELIFPQEEIAYIAIHLLGTKMITHLNIGDEEIPNLIDEEIHNLTIKILENIENKLQLDIVNDRELAVAISLHLKPAINRYRFGMNIRNPLLAAIKTNYPVAFEAGILARAVLKQEMEIDINENEIGYLALHIGAAMERRRIDRQLKRCIIVCASGIGSAQLLKYKLQSKFGTKLEIAAITEYYKLSETALDGMDFIVSTIPISDSLPIPIIIVNTFLGGSDFEKIEMAMTESPEQTITYTKEELVFLQKKFDTREEVLYFLTHQLHVLGLVSETFIDSVLEREALSPTSFGNLVAIPHPHIPQTDTTFWTICTLQKPVTWEDKPVQFVCLLSVERNSTADLNKMYRLLGNVIDDTNKIQRLLKCKTYKEFIKAFM
ncbi:BglG family transcription antiterminator [Bacillus sp. V59.32b]|uniref:BglG family transcription antiterminator n=1 Tax=Bacillus sp. V59.32b TaxID=1758642 RepID=UPI000E3D5EB1|nr:BglG family transcription antiterminator [Bacillus sp. V59.32b]RFU69916.1 transcription antiterminator [Bacillus sp. V59.32b]